MNQAVQIRSLAKQQVASGSIDHRAIARQVGCHTHYVRRVLLRPAVEGGKKPNDILRQHPQARRVLADTEGLRRADVIRALNRVGVKRYDISILLSVHYSAVKSALKNV